MSRWGPSNVARSLPPRGRTTGSAARPSAILPLSEAKRLELESPGATLAEDSLKHRWFSMAETVRNLLRRKLRTALTVMGIMVGTLALTVMGSMLEKINLLVDVAALCSTTVSRSVRRPGGSLPGCAATRPGDAPPRCWRRWRWNTGCPTGRRSFPAASSSA